MQVIVVGAGIAGSATAIGLTGPGDVARGRRAADPTLSVTTARAGPVGALRDRASAVKTAGPIRRAVEGVVMPIVLRHFYERATGWLYDYDVAGQAKWTVPNSPLEPPAVRARPVIRPGS